MLEARTLKAGALYCLVVAAAGVALGETRILLVTPLAGELPAVALEAPIMLAIAWYACGWAVERLEVSQLFSDRLAMGGVALAGLISAEGAVAMANGRTPIEYFADYARSAILLGVMAQLAFAVFPLIQRRGG